MLKLPRYYDGIYRFWDYSKFDHIFFYFKFLCWANQTDASSPAKKKPLWILKSN